MATVSHKLKSAFSGALAGGGDPASSPLYVFGPFLQFIVGAGVVAVTFGASIWLAVLTVLTVSSVYKLVMIWITDGSGGSGLCEDEFGSWAVKINAGITVIEYTLTFLVSVAALVTFLFDRFQHLAIPYSGYTIRVDVAIFVSLLIGLGVNFGPRLSAKIFGPATLGVIILLWMMMASTIWHYGLHFPSLHLNAFNSTYIHYTLGGYARILALMTGIEVFANLVTAYEGPAKQRSRKAFGSLLIIMGTTSLTMLIVGPAILRLADPTDAHVSVFTQAMDQLLPVPLAYMGTIVGVMVLLSAAAAAAQGLQNLALGLRYRQYIPAWFGSLNRFEVADKPVWLTIIVCIICFIVFGTDEKTYLALYAAGVFILLSLTSWAAVKRLVSIIRKRPRKKVYLSLIGGIIAAVLTTAATIVIFEERFTEGAWFYLVITPIFYAAFTLFRKRLGKPELIAERIGMSIASSTLSQAGGVYHTSHGITFRNILLPLDQTPAAEFALSCAQTIARNYGSTIHLLSVISEKDKENGNGEEKSGKFLPSSALEDIQTYLQDVKDDLVEAEYSITTEVRIGTPAEEIYQRAAASDIDLLIMTSHKHSLLRRWLIHSTTLDVIHKTTPPLIVLRPAEHWQSIRTRFQRILVTLDGSETAEQILPYAKEMAAKFQGELTLLSVPEVSDSDRVVRDLKSYLKRIASEFKMNSGNIHTLVEGSDPAQGIIRCAQEHAIDLIMMVTHGRGGVERQDYVKLGSVAETVLENSTCPLFLVSAENNH